MQPLVNLPESARARFEEIGWDVTEGGCWEWRGVRNIASKPGVGDYGRFSRGGRKSGRIALAHRVAYALYVGNPDGLKVMHNCDNPPCVNPAHLSLGTQRDNVHDMQAKGRANSVRKYDSEQIEAALIAYYRDGMKTSEVRDRYGINPITFTRFRTGAQRPESIARVRALLNIDRKEDA